MSEGENLLIVVDQFEELFRFVREARCAGNEHHENDAAVFVKLLLEAIKPESGNFSIYVVLAMRSDFLGDCAQFWDFPEVISESQHLIPRFNHDQLHEIIEGPIAVGGGRIAPRLVNQLIADMGNRQNQLPLLQYSLRRIWEIWKQEEDTGQGSVWTNRHPQWIDLHHYEAIGRIFIDKDEE
jgi:hypothetical protein